MSAIEILKELQSRYFVHQETFDFFIKRREYGFTKAYFDLPISEARESSLRSYRLFSGSVDYPGTTKNFNVPSEQISGTILK